VREMVNIVQTRAYEPHLNIKRVVT